MGVLLLRRQAVGAGSGDPSRERLFLDELRRKGVNIGMENTDRRRNFFSTSSVEEPGVKDFVDDDNDEAVEEDFSWCDLLDERLLASGKLCARNKVSLRKDIFRNQISRNYLKMVKMG